MSFRTSFFIGCAARREVTTAAGFTGDGLGLAARTARIIVSEERKKG